MNPPQKIQIFYLLVSVMSLRESQKIHNRHFWSETKLTSKR